MRLFRRKGSDKTPLKIAEACHLAMERRRVVTLCVPTRDLAAIDRPLKIVGEADTRFSCASYVSNE
ncbi:MAG: hypothetical protein ACI8WB_006178 [Phenylobacterium sp.]|jgi:hypothetical protein